MDVELADAETEFEPVVTEEEGDVVVTESLELDVVPTSSQILTFNSQLL